MLQWEGHDIELVDTAGWIRRTKLAAYDESGERLYCLQCRMLRSGTRLRCLLAPCLPLASGVSSRAPAFPPPCHLAAHLPASEGLSG